LSKTFSCCKFAHKQLIKKNILQKMTGKLKTQLPQQSKYEAEIQKLRNENKWSKLRDLIGTISIKDKKSGIKDLNQ